MPPNAVNLMYFRGLKPIYVDEKRAFLGEDTGGTPVLQKKVHGVACHPNKYMLWQFSRDDLFFFQAEFLDPVSEVVAGDAEFPGGL
jgi:hypothetical protein